MNELQKAGAGANKPTRFGTLHQDRFITGLWTERSPLRDAASPYLQSRFYGSRYDSMIDGSNVELTNRLTLARRPGQTVYNSATFPAINSFYSFRQFTGNSESITVLADTATDVYACGLAGANTKTSILSKGAGSGQTYFQEVGNTLFLGDGVEQKKWLSPIQAWVANTAYHTDDFPDTLASFLIDSNFNIQKCTAAGTVLTLTQVVVSGGNAVYSYSSFTGAAPVVGASFVFAGWVTAGNNVTAVLTVVSGGASGTVTVAKTTQVNETDAGTGTSATALSGGSQPTWATSYLATTLDNNLTWTCYGPALQNWGTAAPLAAPNNQPLAFVGATCRYWSPNCPIAPGYTVLDVNGNIELMTGTLPTPVSPTTAQATTATSVNGVVPTHLPVTTFGSSPATFGFDNPELAFDGNTGTSASAISQHTNSKRVCVWGFSYSGSATITSITLNVLSGANAPIMSGTPMIAGMWYSIDNGASWTALWTESTPTVRVPSWATASIPASTSIGNILVCAYFESHDDMGEQVYEINLTLGQQVSGVSGGTPETSGAHIPIWNTNLYGVTTDGQAFWVNQGPIGKWVAGQVYTVSGPTGAILDSNNNLQVLVATGTSGSVQPMWNTTPGQQTTDGTTVWLNCGLGTVAATSGWDWAYGYHTVDGHVSTASPASLNTGPVLGTILVPLSGVGSDDRQCDAIWLFRTVDGGSTLLYEDSVANPGTGATWTFQDTHPDSDVNEFLQAAIADENDPPPSGFINLTYHLGSVWGSVGNTVSWSRTPNDAIVGSSVQSFPPVQNFVFPSKVTRLWPNSQGLLVFTVSDIWLIVGTTAASLFAVMFAEGIGLRSYNAFDKNGSIPYLFTADGQLLMIDPGSGFSKIGGPIASLLAAFDPTKVHLAFHVSGYDEGLYVSDGSTGWYRLSPTTAPEVGLAWSPKASIACSAVQSVETAPGVRNLLVSPATSGPILKRDLTVFADNGSAYAAFATVGSITLADPGQLAEIEFVTTDCKAVGSHPTLSSLMNEISGSFTAMTSIVPDPPQLTASSTVFGDRFYFVQTQAPQFCRHLQLKFSWPSEAAQNELLAYTIYGASRQEQ